MGKSSPSAQSHHGTEHPTGPMGSVQVSGQRHPDTDREWGTSPATQGHPAITCPLRCVRTHSPRDEDHVLPPTLCACVCRQTLGGDLGPCGPAPALILFPADRLGLSCLSCLGVPSFPFGRKLEDAMKTPPVSSLEGEAPLERMQTADLVQALFTRCHITGTPAVLQAGTNKLDFFIPDQTQ